MIEFNVTAKDQLGNIITTPLVVRVDAGLSGTVRNTNPANFYNGPPLTYAWVGDIEIIAAGYAPYSTGADPQIFFKDSTLNFEAVLTPSFKKPSRDQIVNVKANFCNLVDSEGLPIFEDFIDALIVDGNHKAQDWVNILKANGSTHINLAISGDYNENLGWIPRYPIRGMDWTNDIAGFSQILRWVQSRGLIPIVKLALDGQVYDPVGWTYGWNWGIQNMPKILPQLSKFYNEVLWSTGYDGCFPNWSPDQTVTMLKLLRNILGYNACIDTEFGGPGSIGYCHMGNGSGDWTPDRLGILDNFSIELNTNPPEPTGLQQVASRLLGPRATNIQPQNAGPYYLQQMSGIKKINICMYETVAYWAIRKQVTQTQILASNRLCANYGYTSFGNGQP